MIETLRRIFLAVPERTTLILVSQLLLLLLQLLLRHSDYRNDTRLLNHGLRWAAQNIVEFFSNVLNLRSSLLFRRATQELDGGQGLIWSIANLHWLHGVNHYRLLMHVGSVELALVVL